MPPSDPAWSNKSGWQGIALIAATYVYFLIFAQFGFLKRLDELGIAGAHLKAVMAAMAGGGILASLLAPRIVFGLPALRLRCGLAGCGVAALLTTLALTAATGVLVAFVLGASLGLLTVTLVANLDTWVGGSAPLLKVGLGTGLGYFLCNVPALFTASPRTIALAAAVVCALAMVITFQRAPNEAPVADGQRADGQPTFAWLLAWFTALVWLDSAAFFIIQNSPALKSGTWEGAGHLWRNGALHFAGALGSAWLLRRRGLAFTLLGAFLCLGGACLLLLDPANASLAAVLYPVGVSLYSVALVAAPAFLLRTGSYGDRARKAGWIYAVAGWTGSALGIGMGQNLHHVPVLFVAAAAALFGLPLVLGRSRIDSPQTITVALFLVLGGLGQQWHVNQADHNKTQTSAIARGRRIYIAEGCIHCHSQYIRSGSQDVLLWGPARDLAAIRSEQPPLIGNRRQGPDLSEAGSRRSPLWLRMHFINPRDVSYGSIMPSYSFLFRDDRGAALVAYIESLRSPDSDAHRREVMATWTPRAGTSGHEDGQTLFSHDCATCHQEGGKARERWGASFKRLPPNLQTDPLRYVPSTETSEARVLRIARIVKFGIGGTDMPGHEYLPDEQIEAIAQWVAQVSAR